MTLPRLTTQRLVLRPRTMADLEPCFAMDREPGTLDYIDWPEDSGSWSDEIAHRAFIRSRIRGPYPPGMGYWVVATNQAPDAFLGWVLLIPEDGKGPEVEIGWRLVQAARGQNYAPEAAAALLYHARYDLRLAKVIADIYPANTASCRVARKIGMTDTGPTPGAPHLVRFAWRA